MDHSEVQRPIVTIVRYKPKQFGIDTARYVGQKALVSRYSCSKTRHPIPLLNERLIKFASGVILPAPENDIELSGEK